MCLWLVELRKEMDVVDEQHHSSALLAESRLYMLDDNDVDDVDEKWEKDETEEQSEKRLWEK